MGEVNSVSQNKRLKIEFKLDEQEVKGMYKSAVFSKQKPCSTQVTRAQRQDFFVSFRPSLFSAFYR